MSNLNKVTLAALLTTAMAFSAGAVMAGDDVASMEKKIEAFGLISIDEAKKIALDTKPGIVDDIELDSIDNGGGWEYEVEVVQEDGTEWDIDINAKTGEIRKIDRD